MHHSSPQFSEYIVFVDESGSPTLTPIDPDYPIFALIFCIIEKNHYADKIQPAIKKLKFEFFGHDATILHSNLIRKPRGEFSFLLHPERRKDFMEKLSSVLMQAEFRLIAQVIHKKILLKQYTKPFDPYHIALRMCLEQTSKFLKIQKQEGKLTHIIVESRGEKEDRDLELEFRRILDPRYDWGNAKKFPIQQTPFELRFVEKKINSAGLQFADLAGQPIGRHIINPNQPSQAFDVIKPKIWERIWQFP